MKNVILMFVMIVFVSSLMGQTVKNEVNTKQGVIDPNPNELFKTLQFDSSSNDILYVNNIGDSLLDYTASIDYDGFVSDSTVHENYFETVLGWTASISATAWSRTSTYDGGSLNGTPMAFVRAGAGGAVNQTYLTSGIIDLSYYSEGSISFQQKKTNVGTSISTAFVEVSVDSVNWAIIYSTQDSLGTWESPDLQVLKIPGEYCSSTTRIRYHASLPRFSGYWAIDNIVIKGIVSYSWLTLDGGATTSGTAAVSGSDPITVGFNSAGLAEGTYTANIRLNSQYSNVSVPVQLNVVDVVPPAVPVLVSPTDGQELSDRKPYFDWNDVADAMAYNIVVDNNSDYSSPEINTEVTTSYYQPVFDLADGTYFWKVRSKNEAGYSTFSSPWSVKIIFAYIPIIIDPIILPPNTLDWPDMQGATSYNIYSSPDPYGTFTFLANVTESQYTFSTADPRMFFFITGVNDSKEQPRTIEIPKKVK